MGLLPFHLCVWAVSLVGALYFDHIHARPLHAHHHRNSVTDFVMYSYARHTELGALEDKKKNEEAFNEAESIEMGTTPTSGITVAMHSAGAAPTTASPAVSAFPTIPGVPVAVSCKRVARSLRSVDSTPSSPFLPGPCNASRAASPGFCAAWFGPRSDDCHQCGGADVSCPSSNGRGSWTSLSRPAIR